MNEFDLSDLGTPQRRIALTQHLIDGGEAIEAAGAIIRLGLVDHPRVQRVVLHDRRAAIVLERALRKTGTTKS